MKTSEHRVAASKHRSFEIFQKSKSYIMLCESLTQCERSVL